MLEVFEGWFMANAPRLREAGIRVVVTREEARTDKASAYADLDTEGNMARVTLWDTGECHIEVMDIQSEETVLSEHSVIETPEALSSALAEFCDQLALQKFPHPG